MIAPHSFDTELSVARRRRLATRLAPSAMPISRAADPLDEIASSDLSFEIDWFLAAVLMSTPAGAVEPSAE